MYNKKIITSGQYTEIWEYEKPIFSSNGSSETEENISNKKKVKKRDFDELTLSEQRQKLERMKKRRLDAKWRLQRLIESNFDDDTSFLTLTTKDNIQDREVFISLFKAFIKRFNYQVYNTKKSKLKYVGCLEKQKRGAYHIHLLLFNVPFVPHKKLLNIWGLGAVRINKLANLDDSSHAGLYVSKYMEKGIGQELLMSFGKKSYFRSRNLKVPTEVKTMLLRPLKFDEKLIVYETRYVSKIYVDGEYIDNPVYYRKILNKLD